MTREAESIFHTFVCLLNESVLLSIESFVLQQVSGQKSEKHRLIVDHVNPESPADTADIKKVISLNPCNKQRLLYACSYFYIPVNPLSAPNLIIAEGRFGSDRELTK